MQEPRLPLRVGQDDVLHAFDPGGPLGGIQALVGDVLAVMSDAGAELCATTMAEHGEMTPLAYATRQGTRSASDPSRSAASVS